MLRNNCNDENKSQSIEKQNPHIVNRDRPARLQHASPISSRVLRETATSGSDRNEDGCMVGCLDGKLVLGCAWFVAFAGKLAEWEV